MKAKIIRNILATAATVAMTFGLTGVVDAKKCKSRCQRNKKNLAFAKRLCKEYKASTQSKGPCTVLKQKRCAASWATLSTVGGALGGGGAKYRVCVRKKFLRERNRKRAEHACKTFSGKLERPCKVRRRRCGSGWRKFMGFGHGRHEYRACRKKYSDESKRTRKRLNKRMQQLIQDIRRLFGIK